jgi:tetrahydromethanopterin S-methyltransferase subunit G
MSEIIILEDAALVEGDEPIGVAEEQALNIQHINKRLDMLDQRLDNIDSMVTAVAERVMNQLITLDITCPHCSKNVEIAIVGNQKPSR